MGMLLRTMIAIDEIGSYSKDRLAKNLGTSEAVVDDLISQLVRMGYIRQEDINMTKCRSCPSYKNGCLGAPFGKPLNALIITEKGKQLINNADRTR